MSLIIFLFYWIVIPAAIIAAGIWLWRRAAATFAKAAETVIGVSLLSGFLWLAIGEKWFYDQQVRELCAKDGRVKVYETVRLPKERFNEWGQVRIPNKKIMLN